MNTDLRKYFRAAAIVDALGRLPELKTPIMDKFFSDVRNVPKPIIGIKDMGLPTGNVPVVRRGSSSIPLAGQDGKLSFVEPQPVNPSDFVSGADLNNLRAMNETSIQQEIDNIIDRLRRASRATAEALAAQALTGKIAYWMRGGPGDLLAYEVDYGTIGTATISTKFDASGAKLSDVIKGISLMLAELKKKSDGNNISILAGMDVFAVLCDLVGAVGNASVASAAADGLMIGGGLKIELDASTYKNLQSKAAVPVVPAKSLLIVDKGAGHKMIYAGLDSIESGQTALPFFVTYEETKDPSGIKVIGESKPLPVVNVNGLVKAQVLT